MEATPLSAGELAELADQYWLAYQQRLAADKVAAELKTKENQLSAKLTEEMLNQKLTSIGGKLLKVSLPTEPEYVPAVTDWNEFYEFVMSSKDLSLLERRVSKAAIKERWASDISVPGISKFPVYKLSKSQVKG